MQTIAAGASFVAEGPFIRLQDANFANNTSTTIAEVPLDTSHQQIFFELSHPSTANDTIVGSYAYMDNGVMGQLTQLGTYDDLFQTLDYTQAGFTQLAMVPEPSSLALLGCGLFAFVAMRARNCRPR